MRAPLALLLAFAAVPALAQEAPSRLVCTGFREHLDRELGRNPDSLQLNNLLSEAARKGCADAVQRLLAAGASRLARNAQGETPLAVAAKAGRGPIVEMLLKSAAPEERRQIDMPDARGSTPLMLAIHAGRPPIARTLLEAGAGIDAINASGQTALSEAAFAADEDTGALLLAKGAKADTLDRVGKSPLDYASARGAARLVGLMLDAGIDVNARDRAGLTALMWAAGRPDLTSDERAVETLRLLIARGAKLDLVDERGRSALIIAAALNRYETARVLLEAGADRNLQDKDGKTAADLAATPEMQALAR
jgi:uncharacterized protein